MFEGVRQSEDGTYVPAGDHSFPYDISRRKVKGSKILVVWNMTDGWSQSSRRPCVSPISIKCGRPGASSNTAMRRTVFSIFCQRNWC